MKRVDPQNCTPKDRDRCNQDSAGNRDGSEYLNGRVCRGSLGGGESQKTGAKGKTEAQPILFEQDTTESRKHETSVCQMPLVLGD